MAFSILQIPHHHNHINHSEQEHLLFFIQRSMIAEIIFVRIFDLNQNDHHPKHLINHLHHYLNFCFNLFHLIGMRHQLFLKHLWKIPHLSQNFLNILMGYLKSS